MSNTTNIIKDTDQEIEIIINDENSDPIDLTGFSGIVVNIFQKSCPIDKFSLNVQSGFRPLTITDAINGKFEIYLNADQLNDCVNSQPIYYEVKTEAVNVNFDGGVENKSTGEIELGVLEKTKLKNISFS
tara:strand:+ start:429 stop:818 length:390 start_codon:yes stop_codon:yes gene_type:complete